MKFLVATTAVVAALALATFSTAHAAVQSTLHIRVHVDDDSNNVKQTPGGPVAEWGQCKWTNQNADQRYSQCLKEPASLYGQCAGPSWDGSCDPNSNSKCVRTSDHYGQCVPKQMWLSPVACIAFEPSDARLVEFIKSKPLLPYQEKNHAVADKEL